jgi:hypothetical protein
VSKFFLLIFTIAIVISVAWIFSDNTNHEAWIVLIGLVVTFIPIVIQETKQTNSFIQKLIKPILIRKKKATPDITYSFDSIVDGHADKHTITAMAIWSGDSRTSKKQIIHHTDKLTPYTILLLEDGFGFSFQEIDIDNDGHNEIIMIYHCGAHSRGLKVFKVTSGHFLSVFPGGELGCDRDGIKIEDRDGDGIKEIYMLNRGSSFEEMVESCYVIENGQIKEKLI